MRFRFWKHRLWPFPSSGPAPGPLPDAARNPAAGPPPPRVRVKVGVAAGPKGTRADRYEVGTDWMAVGEPDGWRASMNREKKLLTEVVVVPDEPGVDVKEGDKVFIAANLSGRRVKRTADELAGGWRTTRVDRAEELGEAFGLRMEGSYEGPDGETVPFSSPVTGEESFTPGGMTMGDPGLFRLYCTMRTCEEALRYLGEKKREGLTPGEIEFLEKMAAVLESAGKEEMS